MKISHFDNFMLMHQSNGPTLGLSPLSGISIIHSHGHAFKDLNRNNVLDKYEDWRLSPEERAADLSTKLSLDEIAGLMLYSSHQAVPTDSVGFWSSTYNGTSLSKSGLPISAISDKQKKFLEKDNLRAVLVVRVENPRIAAEWNNNLQAFVEGKGHGIPVNISSDPRNETKATAEYNAGS
ncbi:MAG: beta-glucosidase, partial [Bacteroidales bacterium]